MMGHVFVLEGTVTFVHSPLDRAAGNNDGYFIPFECYISISNRHHGLGLDGKEPSCLEETAAMVCGEGVSN